MRIEDDEDKVCDIDIAIMEECIRLTRRISMHVARAEYWVVEGGHSGWEREALAEEMGQAQMLVGNLEVCLSRWQDGEDPEFDTLGNILSYVPAESMSLPGYMRERGGKKG